MGGLVRVRGAWCAVLGAVTALALPAAALAQGAPGADITHTNIQDTSHFGPIGGIHAYAWGSWTCNIGSSSLSWINGGTPGLGMNAFRMHGGRIVHIGMGNAKGGCCVANGNGCQGGITCSASGFGLRPGCRDIYSSGFNAGQSRLIRRSNINAYTGVFQPVPPGSGDAIWRRCQVREADMSAATYPGALYFAEGIYVCTEEPVQNKNNNATYRQMAVANTGGAPTYVWSTTASQSQIGRPAIYAWLDHGNGLNQPDTNVKVIIADVPGEGRFFAASRAYDNGNGTWRYEYAVYNLTSDRSAETFTVPVDGAATVTNPLFFAPFYHSDEVYNNIPWASARDTVAGTFRWGCTEKFGQNANANALRWGIMFSFSMTVNRAPVLGEASLALFKPGTPSSITIAGLDVPGAPPCIADFNGDGTLNPDDLGDFIDCYFSEPPCTGANFNGDSNTDPDDLGDYINAYFAGC